MKLCRFGKNGYEKPGMIDSQGNLRDLSGVISNIDQDTISPKGLAKLRKIRPESLPLVRTEPRLGRALHGHHQVRGHRPQLLRPRRRGRSCRFRPSRSSS